MANDQDRKRLALFNLYNKNWLLLKARFDKPVKELPDDIVMCPSCGFFFGRGFLDQNVFNPLSLEDVPPRKLGGKPQILTCKKCNNAAGGRIDSKLKEYLEKKPFLDGEVGSEIRLSSTLLNYDGGSISSSAILKRIGEHQFFFDVDLKRGEPRHAEFQKLHTKVNASVDFKFNVPPIKHVEIALLRIAYLLLFKKFGHAFCFNKNYDAIRKQIENPNADVLACFGVFKNYNIDAREGVYLWAKSTNLRSFIVVFDTIHNNRKQRNVVFVPSPLIESIKFYKELNSLGHFSFDFGERFLDVDFLTDPKYLLSWLNAFGNKS